MKHLASRIRKKLVRTTVRIRKRFSSRGHILMYHSIGEGEMDPWRMQVTSGHFEEHLQVIKRIARPVSMTELVSMHREGRIQPNSLAITFDDGYANNSTKAKPLLEKTDLPATVYAVPGFIRGGKPFWWNQLEQIVLKPGKLPREIQLTLGGKDFRWRLGEAAEYSGDQARADRNRHPWGADPGTRLGFYFSLWNALFKEHPSRHRQLIEEIRQWAGIPELDQPEDHRPMSPAQLADLAKGGLIEVGGHTANHTNLAALSLELQEREILEGKQDLEAITGRPVGGFAYPFGQYTQDTVALLAQKGFQHACTIQQESLWSGNSLLELPRWEVRDCDGEAFERNLTRWLAE